MLAVLCAALVGCGGGGGPDEHEIAFSTVDQTLSSGITTAQTNVASTQAEWSALWARHIAGLAAPPPIFAIDFGAEQVAAVHLGTKPNGCLSVEILRVVQSAKQRQVMYRENQPGPTSLCAAVIITPGHIVRFAAASTPVVFVRVTTP